MIRSACIFVALGLAATGSTALAAPAKTEPVMMTDAQMDNVTAGELAIVFQDSFNNWVIDFGGSTGGSAAHLGNGSAKGWERGKGNPHQSASASSGTSSSNSMVFQVNIIANVNTAIAGGDATAGQTVGTQTVAFTPTRR